jgi:hypothetical protein
MFHLLYRYISTVPQADWQFLFLLALRQLIALDFGLTRHLVQKNDPLTFSRVSYFSST